MDIATHLYIYNFVPWLNCSDRIMSQKIKKKRVLQYWLLPQPIYNLSQYHYLKYNESRFSSQLIIDKRMGKEENCDVRMSLSKEIKRKMIT